MEELIEKSALILDDNVLFQRILKSLLEEEGFKVHLADNGKSGLDIFRKEKCTVAIVDIFMPIMDGLTFLREIAPSPESPFEVIAVTGNSDSDTVKKSFAHGASHLLVKPLNFTQVKELVKKIYEKKQAQLNKSKELEAMQEKIDSMEKVLSNIKREISEIINECPSQNLAKNLETLKSLFEE
jgi:DNA-binding NtrC family response regulator